MRTIRTKTRNRALNASLWWKRRTAQFKNSAPRETVGKRRAQDRIALRRLPEGLRSRNLRRKAFWLQSFHSLPATSQKRRKRNLQEEEVIRIVADAAESVRIGTGKTATIVKIAMAATIAEAVLTIRAGVQTRMADAVGGQDLRVQIEAFRPNSLTEIQSTGIPYYSE